MPPVLHNLQYSNSLHLVNSAAELDLIAAPDHDSIRADIVEMLITNGSATACVLTFRRVAAAAPAADNVIDAATFRVQLPAAIGGGFSSCIRRRGAAGEKWTVQCSSPAVTIDISVGYELE